jgi:hypothetical protein
MDEFASFIDESTALIDADVNEIQREVQDDAFTSSQIDFELEDLTTPLNSKEIAVLLVEPRCRHFLTRSCVTHP